MKKAGVCFVSVTVLFSVFLGGFFLGRNYGHSDVELSQINAPAPVSEETTAPTVPAESININIASVQQLATLPGIGEVLAQRIVDYRNEHGSFQKLTDLTNVEGIGEKKLEAILPYITLGGNG